MESWSSRVPSSSGVNAVGSVVLSLSDIYLILDVNACSVKGFGVCHLPQDMGFIVSDFAEFARRESRAAIGRLRVSRPACGAQKEPGYTLVENILRMNQFTKRSQKRFVMFQSLFCYFNRLRRLVNSNPAATKCFRRNQRSGRTAKTIKNNRIHIG